MPIKVNDIYYCSYCADMFSNYYKYVIKHESDCCCNPDLEHCDTCVHYNLDSCPNNNNCGCNYINNGLSADDIKNINIKKLSADVIPSASEFIISKIDQLVVDMPNIKCSYEVDAWDNTHIIKIEPAILLDVTRDYLFEDNGFLCEFTEKFMFEGFTIITSDDIFDIEKPIYIKEGDKFK